MIAQQLPAEPFATPEIAWSAIAPLLVLFGGALLLLTLAALSKATWPRGASTVITVVASAAAAGSALALRGRVTDVDDRGAFTAIANAITIDAFSIFLTVLICVGVALSALLSDDYLRREDLDGPELHALMLLSATGGIVMAMANDLIVLFLGLEALSIGLYVMAAMQLLRLRSQEAAIKYFVLGALSSGMLLYGASLLYGFTGTTQLDHIAAMIVMDDRSIGLVFVFAGLAFKISAVPFHMWTPDVYEGAPTPVTAFFASAPKVAAMALLVRVAVDAMGPATDAWQQIVIFAALASTILGGVAAIGQRNIKRLLA